MGTLVIVHYVPVLSTGILSCNSALFLFYLRGWLLYILLHSSSEWGWAFYIKYKCKCWNGHHWGHNTTTGAKQTPNKQHNIKINIKNKSLCHATDVICHDFNVRTEPWTLDRDSPPLSNLGLSVLFKATVVMVPASLPQGFARGQFKKRSSSWIHESDLPAVKLL